MIYYIMFIVFFVFVFFILFFILEVYSDFVKEAHFDIFGVTGVKIVGGIGVVFDGVVGSFPILRVHDSSIVIAFGGPFLTSLLRFHIIIVMLLLTLLIKRRLSLKFLVHLVLVLWIEGRMCYKLEILALANVADLDL